MIWQCQGLRNGNILINKGFEEANVKLNNTFEIATLHSGDAFGERSIIYDQISTKNILCKTSWHFAVLSGDCFKKILLDIELKRNSIMKKVKYLIFKTNLVL